MPYFPIIPELLVVFYICFVNFVGFCEISVTTRCWELSFVAWVSKHLCPHLLLISVFHHVMFMSCKWSALLCPFVGWDFVWYSGAVIASWPVPDVMSDFSVGIKPRSQLRETPSRRPLSRVLCHWCLLQAPFTGSQFTRLFRGIDINSHTLIALLCGDMTGLLNWGEVADNQWMECNNY